MEPVSVASFALASILASLPANTDNSEPVSQSVITTHISPAIAGQWEIDLSSGLSTNDFLDSRTADNAATARLNSRSSEPTSSNELRVADTEGGVIDQSERRIIVIPNTNINNLASNKQSLSAAQSNQCRELYNFGADNELWTVSGKEWTYGRYLVTQVDEGLPIIAIKTIYDNNEVDCSGYQVDQTGEALIAFLNHKGNKMQWCADPEGQECFMNFRKVLP